ncbi:MAG TPA: PHB depolymerase family esterase [Candidatus Acidoferrales bacterium]|nr:PHB depolymerase family esterase [Candidatus Acidoferrales bacterium]
MRFCRLLLGLLLVGAPISAIADIAARPSVGCTYNAFDQGRHLERKIKVDGTSRDYILDVPDTIRAQTPAPLLFDFHGFGHSGEGVWQVSEFKGLAASEHFVTVYPEGLSVHLLNRDGAGWDIFKGDGNRDIAFVKAMLAHIEDSYCIDLNRIYATGFSNGAFLSNLLACTMADTFAAVAPVSGGRLTMACTPSRAIPIMIHHGRNDPLIAVAQAREMRDAWVEKNACHEKTEADGCENYRGCRSNADVVYCEDDGEHHWPVAATPRIWNFFKKHPMP